MIIKKQFIELADIEKKFFRRCFELAKKAFNVSLISYEWNIDYYVHMQTPSYFFLIVTRGFRVNLSDRE